MKYTIEVNPEKNPGHQENQKKRVITTEENRNKKNTSSLFIKNFLKI